MQIKEKWCFLINFTERKKHNEGKIKSTIKKWWKQIQNQPADQNILQAAFYRDNNSTPNHSSHLQVAIGDRSLKKASNVPLRICDTPPNGEAEMSFYTTFLWISDLKSHLEYCVDTDNLHMKTCSDGGLSAEHFKVTAFSEIWA